MKDKESSRDNFYQTIRIAVLVIFVVQSPLESFTYKILLGSCMYICSM